MPTNTRKYMREYQRWKRNPEKYSDPRTSNVKNSLQIVKKDVKKFNSEILHPPRAPVKVEKSDEGNVPDSSESGRVLRPSVHTDSKTIDFSYLTNNSSFQRAIMEFIRKFVPGLETIKVRGNKEVLKQSFNENANNYRNVMKELKEVLKKRDERKSKDRNISIGSY